MIYQKSTNDEVKNAPATVRFDRFLDKLGISLITYH